MTKFRKLGCPMGHRMSMLRTMVSQLVKHERIETIVAKAKEVQQLADNMVQLGKEGSLSVARRAAAFVRGMMSYTSYLQNWLTDTKIEQVDTQDYFELAYELVMRHQWLI